MATPEKILVRGVNWLGDAVMTTPALRRLREARPDAHITLITPEKLAALWPGHPSLDATLTFNDQDTVFSLARRLRAERFDSAVVFPNSPRSALEVFLARIPRRIGYARGGRNFLLTEALPARTGAVKMHKRTVSEIEKRIAANAPRETFHSEAHHLHDYLQLVAALGANPTPLAPLLHVCDEEVAATCARFKLDGSGPLFALNPGAEYGPAKRWPAERFVDAAVQLRERYQCRWVVLGGRSDVDLAREMATQINARTRSLSAASVAGQTSLRELCAVLKACALVITNDTGPMHVAAALGTPVVVPFGSTSPELTGPAFVPASPHALLQGDVSCAPCFLRECPIDFRCMRSIPVQQVVEAAWGVWRGLTRDSSRNP
jgi:heptosyltransferase-2